MRALFVGILTLAVTQAVATQESAQPPSSKGVVIKGQAPVATDVLKVKLPRPIEGDLANGLHLMVLEDHRVSLLSFQLQIQGAGGFYDPAEQAGLASFTASLLREGTATKTAPQIAKELDTMAASLFAGAGQSSQSASISGNCLAEQFDRLLTMTSDIVLHPAFAQEEIDRVKVQRKAQLLQQRSSPGFLAQEMFAKVTYGTHPAGRISATPAFVNNVTRDDLVTFHRAHYIPDFAVLIQNAVKPIGGAIKVNVLDQGAYYGDAVYGKSPWLDSDMGITDYGHRGVPNVFLSAPLMSEGTWNAAHFKNGEYDKLVAGYIAALDIEAQRAAAGKIEKLLLDETPVLFVYFYDFLTATKKGVTGVQPTAMGHLLLGKATI